MPRDSRVADSLEIVVPKVFVCAEVRSRSDNSILGSHLGCTVRFITTSVVGKVGEADEADEAEESPGDTQAHGEAVVRGRCVSITCDVSRCSFIRVRRRRRRTGRPFRAHFVLRAWRRLGRSGRAVAAFRAHRPIPVARTVEPRRTLLLLRRTLRAVTPVGARRGAGGPRRAVAARWARRGAGGPCTAVAARWAERYRGRPHRADVARGARADAG